MKTTDHTKIPQGQSWATVKPVEKIYLLLASRPLADWLEVCQLSLLWGAAIVILCDSQALRVTWSCLASANIRVWCFQFNKLASIRAEAVSDVNFKIKVLGKHAPYRPPSLSMLPLSTDFPPLTKYHPDLLSFAALFLLVPLLRNDYAFISVLHRQCWSYHSLSLQGVGFKFIISPNTFTIAATSQRRAGREETA